MSYCQIGQQGKGFVVFKKTQFEESINERATSVHTIIDGAPIHIVSSADQTERSPSVIARLNSAQRTILLDIFFSTTAIIDFDDGESTYRGYIKSCNLVQTNRNIYTYRIGLMLTARVK
jgi:hypothetical protein